MARVLTNDSLVTKSEVLSFISGSGVTLDNCAFVSKNGNDGTGTVGSMLLPYLTIAAAYAAISANQVVVVYPGAYQLAATLTLVTNKHLYFIGTGTVTLDTTGSLFNDSLFASGGTQVTNCVIYGPGWDFQARSSQILFDLGSSSPSSLTATCRNASCESAYVYNGKGNFELNCENITGTDTPVMIYPWGSQGSLVVNCANTAEITAAGGGTILEIDSCSYVSFNAKRVQQHASNAFYAIHSASCTATDKIYVNCEVVQSGTEWAIYFEGSSPFIYVTADRVTANSDCTFTTSTPRTFARVSLIETTSSGAVDGAVHGEDGELIVIGAKIEATSKSSGNDVLASGTGGKVTLVGCYYDRTKINNTTSDKRAVTDMNLTDGFVTVAASDTTNSLRVGANYICDGTDDESEINTASGIANVKLMEGTFLINTGNSILLNNNERMIIGSGKGTLLKYGSGSAGGKIIKNSNTNAVQGLTLRDFSIDGQDTAGYGIYLELVGSSVGKTAVRGFDISNLWIQAVKQTGVDLETCMHGRVSNCKMIHSHTGTGLFLFDGIAMRKLSGQSWGCVDVVVSDCQFFNNTAGIWMQYSNNITINNCNYEGDSSNTAGNYAYQIENCKSITINGGVVSHSVDYGVGADDHCLHITVNGVIFEGGCASYGVSFGEAFYSVVTGCEFHNILGTGVLLNVPHSQVIGCTFRNIGLGANNSFSNISITDDYCKAIGNDISAMTSSTSTTSVAIPTSHPTSVSLTTQDNLSYEYGSPITVTNDGSHFFTGTITSYNHSSGAMVVSSLTNTGTGTFASWTLTMNLPQYGIRLTGGAQNCIVNSNTVLNAVTGNISNAGGGTNDESHNITA